MKKLKGDIYIYPRYSSLQLERINNIVGLDDNNIVIYHGEVKNIPESIAKELVECYIVESHFKPLLGESMYPSMIPPVIQKKYYYYGDRKDITSFPYLTAKASVTSACDGAEYCLIIRKKQK